MELRRKVPNISGDDKISSGFECTLHHPIVIWIPRYRYSFSRHNEYGNLSKVSDESCCPALIQFKVVAGQNFAVFIEEKFRDITAKLFRGRRIEDGCRRAFLMQKPRNDDICVQSQRAQVCSAARTRGIPARSLVTPTFVQLVASRSGCTAGKLLWPSSRTRMPPGLRCAAACVMSSA